MKAFANMNKQLRSYQLNWNFRNARGGNDVKLED